MIIFGLLGIIFSATVGTCYLLAYNIYNDMQNTVVNAKICFGFMIAFYLFGGAMMLWIIISAVRYKIHYGYFGW